MRRAASQASAGAADSSPSLGDVDEERVASMSVKELRAFITAHGGSTQGMLEKDELRAAALRILIENQQANQAQSSVPESPGEEVDAPDDDSLKGVLLRELRTTPGPQIAAFLSKRLQDLANGIRIEDLPPVSGKICGYVFQEGDLAYNCRTCESDSTCVQCQKCFQNSNHEGHEIYFHKAGIGGCCDCGDLEAWAEEGCCNRHGPNSDLASNDPEETLPEPMKSAAHIVFSVCLKFISEVMCEEAQSYVRALESARVSQEGRDNVAGNFHVLMHNDDIHTYEEVIELLTNASANRIAQIDNPERITDLIDKTGRAAVFRGSRLFDAQEAAAFFRQGGLFLSIAKTSQLEKEVAAVAIVAWMKKHCCESSLGLMRVLGRELAKPDTSRTRSFATRWFKEWFKWDNSNNLVDDEGSILDTIVRFHGLWPKAFINQMNELLLFCYVDDMVKLELGVALGRSMMVLAPAYASGLGVKTYTMLDLSVQVFTVKSIVRAYQARYGESLPLALLRAIASFFSVTSTADGKIDLLHRSIRHKRYQQFISQARWCFQLGMFDEMSREDVEAVFKEFIECVLDKATALNSFQRHQGIYHVILENMNFKMAFDLDLHILYVFDAAVASLEDLEANRSATIEILRKAVSVASAVEDHAESRISRGQVSVSFHLPVHRFASQLCRSLINENRGEVLLSTDVVANPLAFAARPVRAVVATSQILLGMWRRDGTMLFNQMQYYSNISRFNMLDPDLFALQMAWSTLVHRNGEEGQKEWLHYILTRFEIMDWFFAGKLPSDAGVIQDNEVNLLEEVVRLFICLVSGLPSVDPNDRLALVRRNVVHTLSVASPKGVTFDRIMEDVEAERLIVDDNKPRRMTVTEADVLHVLSTCARTHETNEGVMYDLRSELWLTDFDPYYWRGDRSQLERVFENREKQIASMRPRKPVAFAPAPLSVSAEFIPVLRGLCGRQSLLEFVGRILDEAVLANPALRSAGVRICRTVAGGGEDTPLGRKDWSEERQQAAAKRTTAGLLRATLHILTIALHHSQYVQAADLCEVLKYGEFSIAEAVVALYSNPVNDAETAAGLEWLLNHMDRAFASQDERLSRLLSDVLSKGEESTNVAKKRKSTQKRGQGAQQAAMLKMQQAQKVSIAKLLEQEGDNSEGEVTEVANDDEKKLTCIHCREGATETDEIGLFGFVECSSWDRCEATQPSLRDRRPPFGWQPPKEAIESNIGSSPAQAQSVGDPNSPSHDSDEIGNEENSDAAVDWGMSNLPGVLGATGHAGIYDDEEEDDDDDEGDDDVDEEPIDDDFMFENAGMVVADFFEALPEALNQLYAGNESPQTSSADQPEPPHQLDVQANKDGVGMVIHGPHGRFTPRLFMRCCPHAIHLRCFAEYRRHSLEQQVFDQAMRYDRVFFCSVCKAPCNGVYVVTPGVSDSSYKSSPCDRTWITHADIRTLLDPVETKFSESSAAASEESLQMGLKGRMNGAHNAAASVVQGLALTWSIASDAATGALNVQEMSPPTLLSQSFADLLKARDENLAVLRTVSQAYRGTMNKMSEVSPSALWQGFVSHGKSDSTVAMALASNITCRARQEDDPNLIIGPPATLQGSMKSEIREIKSKSVMIGLLAVSEGAKGRMLVRSSLQTSEQFVIHEINGQSVAGKTVSQIREMILASEDCALLETPVSNRHIGYVQDVDPFDLFCALLCATFDGSISEAKVRAFTQVSVALALLQFTSRSHERGRERPSSLLFERALGDAHRGERFSCVPTIQEELRSVLSQLVSARVVLFGQRWVDSLGDSILESRCSDVHALWEVLELPQPSPFSTEGDPALLRGLVDLVEPWLTAKSSDTVAIHRTLQPAPLAKHFIPLPERYEMLYSQVLSIGKCPSRPNSPPCKEPAICLFCGDIVCVGAGCCSRSISLGDSFPAAINVGAGSAHTLACSGCNSGVGLLLLVQSAQCVLMYGSRAILMHAPYVDQHGNPDPFLRKGRPLKLNPERYLSIQKMVAEHRLTAHVLRTRAVAHSHYQPFVF